MKGCGIEINDLPNVPIVKSLRDFYQNNTERCVANAMIILNEDLSDFAPEFIEFYKNKYNLKSNPIFKSDNASVIKKVTEAAVEFIDSKPEYAQVGNNPISDTNPVNTFLFNYSEPDARNEGKVHVTNIILNEYKRLRTENKKPKGNEIQHYVDAVRNTWIGYMLRRGAELSNRKYEEVLSDFIAIDNNDKVAQREFLNKILGDNKKTDMNANLYAVYLELTADKAHVLNYINGLFNDPILNQVLTDSDRSLDEYNDALNAESNPELNEESENDIEGGLVELDESFAAYDHSGVKSDFGKHITAFVRIYFDTLPISLSPDGTEPDLNNYFGLPLNMNSRECIQFLYSINEEFKNIPTMIAAIKAASKRVKHFYAFAKFAQDLENDLDFAANVFREFSKPKYNSVEVRVDGNRTTVTEANPRVNGESAMIFDMLNNIKVTVTEDMFSTMSKKVEALSIELNEVKDQIAKGNIKEFKKNKENIIKEITQILRVYFPSLQEDAIRSYLELHNDANNNPKVFVNNCANILVDIKETVKQSENSKLQYDRMQANIEEARRHNRYLDNVKARRTDVWVDQSEYIDESSLYNDDYISGQTTAIRNLVKKLLPYSVPNIRLNNRNIHGNNQSAILNSSWISGLKHMTETFYIDEAGNLRNDELEKWGENKLLRTSQYKYSSLLVEQTDEEGNIVNADYAIFKIVDGKVCLTKNADKIFKIYTFNGASNIEDKTNMAYYEMTGGDFFPSSYMMFFNTKDNINKGLSLATYFPKTPSDAPNAFGIRGPRLDASQIIIVDNPEQVHNNVDELVNTTVPLINKLVYGQLYLNDDDEVNFDKKFVQVKDKYLYSNLTNPQSQIVRNTNAIRYTSPVKENGNRDGYVSYMTESGVVFVIKGEIGPKGNSTYIFNPQLEGVAAANVKTGEDYKELPSDIYNIFYDYYRERLEHEDIIANDKIYNKVKYKIDTNHPVYKLIRNQFKQEILDAAIAVGHYFKLVKGKNGLYFVDKIQGKDGIYHPVMNPGVSNNRGYTNYHIRDGKVLIEDSSNQTYQLTGDVFKFTNFTLNVEDENGSTFTKKYFEHLLDNGIEISDEGLINFLYGEAMFVYDENAKRVTDIQLNDKQLANIDAAMSEYLMDYFQQITKLVEKNENFIKNTPTTRNNIADYASNVLLMMFNTDYLMDGSPKFYKSNQDVIKRVKQYQGSGTPYGSSNYLSSFTPNTDESENSFLNQGYIEEFETEIVETPNGKIRRTKKDENGKDVVKRTYIRDLIDKYPALQGLRERNGFHGVTIKNTRRTNVKALEELKKVLVERCHLSEEKAADLLYGEVQLDKHKKPIIKDGVPVRKGGFQDTKVNDAQSYITMEEFIRRLSAKGQLKRYLPLIERIMDESKEISAEDISEFIQVQKNFYFDMYYDTNYGIEVVRQIKNAEFVLIPRFIKGTQLEKVYEAMKAAGVDQLNTLETSKAANEIVLSLWDDNGDFDEKTIENFVSESQKAKQIYSYNNLYTQQETPQHMDSQNKAGIQIIKKMFDNIPNEGHPLSRFKQDFFKVYSKNIEEGCYQLLERLEVPHDDKGNLTIDVSDENAINLKVLYERLLEEARRTGVDDNQKDYFEINEETGQPYMPSYMNNYLTKFQSVFQSAFNSSITRQKLPGFHAAQTTNIGWKPFGNEPAHASYSKELAYHPNQFKNKANEKDVIDQRIYDALNEEEKKKYENIGPAPYIEVMVPFKALGINRTSAHYKDMTDFEILQELEAKGLLEFIGYRIPTEGKQSVATMKIVGFIDDSYGSTIVVPDDWVSQTGSDFDIDSVYTILFEHETDRSGEIHKIEYKTNRTLEDWKKYIDEYEYQVSAYSSKEVKARKNAVAKLQNELIKQAEEKATKAYEALPDPLKNKIKQIDAFINKKQKGQDLTSYEAYVDRLETRIAMFNSSPLTAKYKAFGIFRDENKKILELLTNKDRTYYDAVVEEYGLLSFEDFVKPENDLIANNRKARNSKIVDIFLNILKDDSSLEENLSRSNFDDITKAKLAKMDPNIAKERAGRNPHNIVDQVSYQEEVMAGRTLKGMSVALDTMCSVCNTARPTLTSGVVVIYNSDNVNADTVKEGFDCEVNEKKKQISVTHNTYGWSKNNKTVTGAFITTYSSETTAYILDAVKEGSIPNLNVHTFTSFKTLCNIGIDFGTSVAFIMQPGIKAIVDVQNSNNSVFNKGYGNEIDDAIINIAKKYQLPVKYGATVNDILKYLNDNHKKEINALFKTGKDNIVLANVEPSIAKLPIISKLLDDRLFRQGKFKDVNSINNAIFDIATVLIYSRLNGIAGRVSSVANCLTSDKFGAKQNVYATRKMFDKIDNNIFKTEMAWTEDENGQIVYKRIKRKKKPILTVDGKHILEAIYPGISDLNKSKNEIIDDIVKNNRIEKSVYPPLYAFLKYSTATSTVIAREVFETENPMFTDVVEGLGRYFSGSNKELSEEAYSDFQRYLLTSMYKKVPAIRYRIHVVKDKNGVRLEYTHTDDQNNPYIEDKVASDKETTRIFGFGHLNNFNIYGEETYTTNSGLVKTRLVPKEVKIANITNPTAEEIADFEMFSPAQKVQFIKTNFSDAGIFNLLEANLFNPKNRGRWQGAQTIEFIDEKTNPNEVYRLFKKAFESNNPLIVSAAIDLVKYAVQVEGLNISAIGITKIIDNDCLINDFNKNGLGFNRDMARQMREISYNESVQTTYENYLRTLPNNVTLRTLYLSDNNKHKYNIYPVSYGTFILKGSDETDNPVENQRLFNKLLVSAGIKYRTMAEEEEYGTNSYIKIVNPKTKTTTLYKINDFGMHIILTPLSKLESNENSLWSAKESNNRGMLSPIGYEKLIGEYAVDAVNNEFNKQYFLTTLEKIKHEDGVNVSDIQYIENKGKKEFQANINFNLEKLVADDTGSAIALKDAIIQHFQGLTTEPLFVDNLLISANINTPGINFGSIQTIKFPNGDKHKFIISIPFNIDKIEKAFLNPKKGVEKLNADDIQYKTLAPIVKRAQENGFKKMSNLGMVTPIDDSVSETTEAYNALIEDKIVDTINLGESLYSTSTVRTDLFDIASKFKNNLRAYDIIPDVESVKNNPLQAIREVSTFVMRTSAYIREELFDKFIEDPDNDNLYISITDPRALEIAKNDARYMDKYMLALNFAKDFLDRVEPLTNEVNDDTQFQSYINDIKEALAKNLQGLPIDKLYENLANLYLKTHSSNPLVQQNFLKVMDGYYQTYGSMWQFHSIMENGTPILQTILSDVMTDLDAKNKAKYRILKEYRDKLKEIQAKAIARGETIDLTHIIDKDGNFIAPYIIDFLDKLEEHRAEVNKYAPGTKEHIQAKLKYDKFKADHINQEAKDEYYQKKLAIEQHLFDTIPELYTKYMELFYKKSAIYDSARKDQLSEEQLKELQNIEAAMYNLYSDNEYINEAGEVVLRESENYLVSARPLTAEEVLDLKLHSVERARILANGIKDLAKLREETFEQEPVRGFERTLKANLALIARLEHRVNGIPTVDQSILVENPDYVKAVAWVRENAYFSLNIEHNPDTREPISIGAKLIAALHRLNRHGNNRIKNEALDQRIKDIRDANGTIDARQLTDAELASIKAAELKSMFDDSNPDFANQQAIDRILITNKKPNNELFSSVFYSRLSSNGERDVNYYRIVTELNKLLAPLLGATDGYIHFERIPDTAEGIELINKIAELYKQLSQASPYRNTTNGEEVSEFIANEVEFVTNTELFRQQVASVKDKSNGFKEAMLGILYVPDKNGSYVKENGDFVPNRFLYSYVKPKGQPGERSYDKYVKSQEKEDRALVEQYYEKVTTEYYEYAKEQALRDGTYNEWYEKNHFYNSFTRRMEPLSCWYKSRIRTQYFADNSVQGKWMPKSKQANRKVRDGKIRATINGQEQSIPDPNHSDQRNPNYKPNVTNAENYKIGSGFDSNIQLNESEKEMRKFLKEVLMATANTNQARRYFEKGRLPLQAKPEAGAAKVFMKELGKSFGIGLDNNNGYSQFRSDIGFSFDESPQMPMLHDLNNKESYEKNKKLKELKDNTPVKDELETEQEYRNRLNAHNEAIKKLENEIRDIRRTVIDNNWYTVIENYLSQAADYNAIQDNKNKLYFLLNVLKDMKMYSRKHGSYGELAKERITSDGRAIYKTNVDAKLLDQYKNFMRRLLFDEWKEQEGKLTTIGNFLQGYASANYMMMNFKGGFANVTLGATGMLAEAAAKEYMGHKNWAKGTAEYIKGYMGYGASFYHYATTGTRRAFNKQGAVIDYCNVVDYDEINGVIRNVDASHYKEQLFNILFSPQSMGEHYMQNSVLFAILDGHKIIETEQGYIPMSKSEYIGYRQYQLLKEILNEDQMAAFNQFKEKIVSNKDELAKYAWFRQDALTRFIYINCDNNQIKEFKTKRKAQREKIEAEFDAKDNIYSQLTMNEEGVMAFVTDSELDRMNSIKANVKGDVTEAELLMARISEKTRHVNNKIHGVYNRREAAHIESKWYGGLIMQYHKHIPMGLLKRYMARGHWNEFRHSVDKGMVQSLYDVGKLNLDKIKKDCNFTEDETTALKSFIFTITHIHKFLTQLNATWEIIPDYEKANIARNLGDMVGVVSALATTAALWAIADDDDPEGHWFNFFLYEADRLGSEAFMWNPYGMMNEGKKLMSTPIAAQSIVTDAKNIIEEIVRYTFDDEYDPYYETGIHAGEHRMSVFMQRRIPVWTQIESLMDLPNNNHVYKLGENAVSLVNIKERIRGN